MGLKTEDTIATQLKAILSFAHALRDAAGVSFQPCHAPLPSSLRTVIDSICLPTAPPLLPSLLDAGINHEIAAGASKLYQLRSDQLRLHIQGSIATVCHKVAELPVAALASAPESFIRSIVSTFTEIYLRRLREWKEEIMQRVKQAPDAPSRGVTEDSRAFNQEYVPLLEHFFKENPFPTRADKLFLAQKSNMQYRQIHVWFQNRRNRTKKEGTPLRRKPTHTIAKEPLTKLNVCTKGSMVSDSPAPMTSRVGPSEEDESTHNVPKFTLPKFTLPSCSPPHAFPSPYPPVCHYDPFPCKGGSVHFSKPDRRRASCRKLPSLLSTSIDELVDKFSRLNVRDETRCSGSSKLPSHAATAAVTVIPSRAPHPSLLPCKYHQSSPVVQRLSIVRASVSSMRVFQSSTSAAGPVTLVPPSVSFNKGKSSDKRRTAPLPRRFPSQMRNTCRDTTLSENPLISATPPRFSPEPESRGGSFSSVALLSTASGISNTRGSTHPFGSPCRTPYDI